MIHLSVAAAIGVGVSLTAIVATAAPAAADSSTPVLLAPAAACQDYTVPPNVNQIDVELIGGAGNAGEGPGSSGGRGGDVTARLDVESGEVLHAIVAEPTGLNQGGGSRAHGGAGGDVEYDTGGFDNVSYGGGGGGATFLSTDNAHCGTTGADVNGNDVLAVAGGGGGGGTEDSIDDSGGVGGDAGQAGGNTQVCFLGCEPGGVGGSPGTLTGGGAGGSFDAGGGGWLGNAPTVSGTNWLYQDGGTVITGGEFGGGGGGGWFGGGQGGDTGESYGGGGGGSDYVQTSATAPGTTPVLGVETHGAIPEISIVPAPTRRLTVAIGAGTGTGSVTSDDSTINCGSTCTAYDSIGQVVTLTEHTPTGMRFAGWTGASCGGSTSSTCQVTMNEAESVTATFNQDHQLTITTSGQAPMGGGTVTASPAGYPCGPGCINFDTGTTVTLTETPDASSVFRGWQTGDQQGCVGETTPQDPIPTDPTCTFTVSDRDLSYNASFTQNVLTIQTQGAGTGTITGTVNGVSCGTSCDGTYPYDSSVVLTATAGPNSTAQWDTYPCDDPSLVCSFRLDGSQTMLASFTKTPETLAVNIAGGLGTVTSDLGGIDCTSDSGCGEAERIFDQGTVVTLTATPETGTKYSNSTFAGWTGACTNSTGPCVVTMQAAESVTAVFTTIPQNTLTVTSPLGNGSGTVTTTDGNINCGNSCIDSAYYVGTSVTLTESPSSPSSSFAGWGGACSGTSPTCTVTMSSSLNVSATFTLVKQQLTVTKAGTGTGTVSGDFEKVGNPSESVQINCGTTCSANYDYGDPVTLTEVPANNAVFVGWSGACTGTGNCNVTMNQAESVTATFTRNVRTLTVATAGAGGGTVTSDLSGVDGDTNQIDCNGTEPDCSEDYDFNTLVTLTATARAADSTFTGWSGACTNTTGTCNALMLGPLTATANFELNNLTVVTAGGGSGTVSSGDSDISCGATCVHDYPTGTNVVLTATPTAGSTFTGWSAGICPGTGTCTISAIGTQVVTATFTTTPSIHVVLAGSGAAVGSVSDGTGAINCGQGSSTCTGAYSPGQAVTLNAEVPGGSSATFDGWSGACSGSASSCTFTPTDAVTVTATFTLHTNPLTVTTNGTGGGTVTSSPAGINCAGSSVCSANFLIDNPVGLTATPDANSTFAGWSGGCSGTGGCGLTDMTVARNVTATFTAKPAFTLTVGTAGTGRATITTDSGGINCGTMCSATYQSGSLVWITATIGANTTFNSWNGTSCIATAGGATNPQCEVQLNSAMTVKANVTLQTTFMFVTTDSGTGTGTVTSTGGPGSISCNTACGASFENNTTVLLTAVPDSDSTFTGWSNGTCQNPGSEPANVCAVLMVGTQNPIATFTHAPVQIHVRTDGGPGTGTVSISGVSTCSFACSATYPYKSGTNVILFATPNTNMQFMGWSTCQGQSGSNECVLNPFTTDLNATAIFAPITEVLTLAISSNDSGTGSGPVTITSDAGLVTCTSACTTNVDQASVVTLTAADGTTGTFANWVGTGCSGTNNVCTLTAVPNSPIFETARYNGVPISLAVSQTGEGTGTITSSPNIINCGATCSTTGPYGSFVRLGATPDAGSQFAGWSGACTNASGSCLVDLTLATTLTATFTLIPNVLTVTTDGSGSGSVTSDVGGIDCGSTCTAGIHPGDDVTLTATPDAASSTFAGWSGDCSGTAPTCVVTVDQARNVDATFTLIPRNLSLTTDGTGTGTVSSDPVGIDCGDTCSTDFDNGTTVVLSVTPDAGSGFTGWTGDCSGTDPCTVSMDAAHAVGATFDRLPMHAITVAVSGSGSGTVTSDPAGIDCGATCSFSYPSDAVVTLTATPTNENSTFVGWTGDCTGGTNPCQVAADQARSVTATFAHVTVPSATTVVLSSASHAYGTTSTATVTVTGGLATPTGSVELKAGSTVIGTGSLAAGSATITVPKTLAAGSHTLTAVYAGSTVLMASHSAGAVFKVTRAKATVTVKLAKKSVAASAKAKLAVTVKTAGSVAAGRVTIKDGSKVIATGRLVHGKVVVTLPKLKPGKHKLTVVYTGSQNVAAGTSKKIVLTVKK